MNEYAPVNVQEEEIPGIAKVPNEAFLVGLAESDDDWISKGGWEKYLGRGDYPTVWFCGACESAFHVASYLSEKKLLGDWESVVVTSQRAGVGQHGRRWVSPEGNLYLAWKIHKDFPEKYNVLGLLPLLLGFSIAEALSMAEISLDIKWPNDLVLNDKKIGGMLIKSTPDLILAGVGINIVHAPDASLLREGASLPAGTLVDKDGFSGTPPDLWRKLFPLVFAFMLKASVPEWTPNLLAVLEGKLWRKGKKVRVYPSQGESFSATLLGLAKDGGLRLSAKKGEEVLYSGSIGLP